MTTIENRSGIPASVKLFAGVLSLAGLFFTYVYAFDPGLVFPGAQITDYSSRFGFYSAGIRVFGSVVGLVIALWLNSPRLLALMLATRLVIELGDLGIGVATGGAMSNNIMLVVLATFELLAIIKLLQVIRSEQACANS